MCVCVIYERLIKAIEKFYAKPAEQRSQNDQDVGNREERGLLRCKGRIRGGCRCIGVQFDLQTRQGRTDEATRRRQMVLVRFVGARIIGQM